MTDQLSFLSDLDRESDTRKLNLYECEGESSEQKNKWRVGMIDMIEKGL